VLLIVTTKEWTKRTTPKSPGEKIVKDIKRATRKHCSSEETIRIVLDGLHGYRRQGWLRPGVLT
tara:strand:+ start:193 stop:384 length:192 start_codon:yes stop_codon:yes gene_type:complete